MALPTSLSTKANTMSEWSRVLKAGRSHSLFCPEGHVPRKRVGLLIINKLCKFVTRGNVVVLRISVASVVVLCFGQQFHIINNGGDKQQSTNIRTKHNVENNSFKNALMLTLSCIPRHPRFFGETRKMAIRHLRHLRKSNASTATTPPPQPRVA